MTEPTIQTVAREIRVADAVVIMGAGVSFSAGMPLAGHLSPLVWHALDSNPDVLEKLCAGLGVPIESAKRLVADDPVRINRALFHIKNSGNALSSFKEAVCNLDHSRGTVPSTAHTALAQLVHAHRVIQVISLNWDTLLERAFRRQFGFEINAQKTTLWKPHGDCNAPDSEWVLPNEKGEIPAQLVTHITKLASVRPRVLLIIGYAERDETVVRKLIAPLANRWRVFRISPTATGEGAIRLTAAEALEQLGSELVQVPSIRGWSIVTFAEQRGIEAAVAGERLGPGDVEACPRLPHFSAAMQKLSLLHFVEVAGESGSGKSITVWQLAHEFHRKGWQVLRLDPLQRSNLGGALDTLKAESWRTLAVVDDSQIFPPELMAQIRASACDRTKVLFGTTDEMTDRPDAVRAAAKAAVESLADSFRSQRSAILPILKHFDPHVGDGFLDIPIETRIEQASNERTPWLFAYVLRGGPKRVRGSLDAAHDFDQADLLLVVIAARQLATLDAGSSVSDLMQAGKHLGRSESWVRSSLELLTKQRSVLNADTVRCLHLQSAASIIQVSLEIRKSQSYSNIAQAIRTTLENTTLPLRGISWLIYWIWPPHDKIIITPDIQSLLVSRCCEAKTKLEIRDACFVLERLLGRRNTGGALTQLSQKMDLLRLWILEADLGNAYAVGSLLNNFHNDSHTLANDLVGGLNPKQLAEKIGTASPVSGRVWGYFTSRLCVAGSQTWRAAVASKLPRHSIRQAIDSLPVADCEEVPDYVEGIAGFDFDFALQLLEIAAPRLADAIGANSLRTYRLLQQLPHWVLGEGLFFDAKPNKRQRAISKRIFEGLIPSEVVNGILTCRFGEWEYYARMLLWVQRAHPKKKRAIIKAMDWAGFDKIAFCHLKKPGRELGLLLATLVANQKSGEPVASWLFKHSSHVEELGPVLAAISPKTALSTLAKGGTINLSLDYRWLACAFAIIRISSLDEKAGRKVVEQNIAHIAKGVTELSLCEGISQFLQVVAEFDGLLEQVLSRIDLSSARERWPKALTDHRPEERKSARLALKFISARSKAEVGQLALQMARQHRFRKRTKP